MRRLREGEREAASGEREGSEPPFSSASPREPFSPSISLIASMVQMSERFALRLTHAEVGRKRRKPNVLLLRVLRASA
jgi:hypothetical protein